MATHEQMQTILRRAVDNVAREMMRDGVVLTEEQADEVGGEGIDWMRRRLGLDVEIEHDGRARCTPRADTRE